MHTGFYASYEATDPEPPLRWQDGDYGRHYIWADVLAHIAWHHRMTKSWIENHVKDEVAVP